MKRRALLGAALVGLPITGTFAAQSKYVTDAAQVQALVDGAVEQYGT